MYCDILDLEVGDIIRICCKEYRVDHVSFVNQSCALTNLKSKTFATCSRFDKIELICREQTLF